MGCQKLIYKLELRIYSSKKLKGRNEMYIYNYRYSFNGQEKDDEVAGEGNVNTAQYWEYDTRLGRRWNLDVKPQAYCSNYSVFSNAPLIKVDPKGNSDYYTAKGTYLGSDGTKGMDIFIVTDKTIIADLKKQIGESTGYLKVAPTLGEGQFFKLPSYEERQFMKTKIDNMKEGNQYEIGGSKYTTTAGITETNYAEGSPTTYEDMAKHLESEQEQGKPLSSPISVNVGPSPIIQVQSFEYTWHVHPDAVQMIKHPVTKQWTNKAEYEENSGMKISSPGWDIGGLTPSNQDRNNGIVHNFLFTQHGENVLYYNNSASSYTKEMSKSFFTDVKAKKKE